MPTAAPTATTSDGVLLELAASDRILVQQALRPLANEYRISIPAPGESEEGEPLLVVTQARMKVKEDIRFRTGGADGRPLFAIASRSVLEARGRHDVVDDAGQVVGTIEKSFAKSLVRSHWRVRDAQGDEVLSAHEASWLIAIARRLGDLVPGGDLLLGFLPFGFVLRHGDAEAGRYRRVLGKLRDRYVLELEPGAADVDRRLVLAFAVALDALQGR